MIFKRLKGIFSKKNKYPFSHMEVKVWERILDITKAKAVVAILPSRELCFVCRQRGVWVTDIQHGVIADEHYWYGQSFRKNDPLDWLPNSFKVWDSGSHAVIAKWAPKNGVHVDIIGNPWVSRFRDPHFNDSIISRLTEIYNVKKRDKPIILVSLSWGGHGLDNKYIHPALEQFIKKTVLLYDWKIRLHPNQMQGFATNEGFGFVEYYRNTFPGNLIDWEITTKMPLPLLLSNIDLHITWLSSVCMEASYFGVCSLVLSPKLQAGGGFESYYEYLSEEGYVTKLKPLLENIEGWVSEKIKSNRLPFYSDHSDNYEKFIENLIYLAGNEPV